MPSRRVSRPPSCQAWAPLRFRRVMAAAATRRCDARSGCLGSDSASSAWRARSYCVSDIFNEHIWWLLREIDGHAHHQLGAYWGPT
jgi:hypothetical protein